MVLHLPPGGARARSADQPWTLNEHMLAHLWDAINQLTYVVAKANGGKPNQPKKFPRPGQEAGRRIGGRGKNQLPQEEIIRRLRILSAPTQEQADALAAVKVKKG